MSAWLVASLIGAVVTVGTVLAARAGIVPPKTPWWPFFGTLSIVLALLSDHLIAWLIFWAIAVIGICTLLFGGRAAKVIVASMAVLTVLSLVIVIPSALTSSDASAAMTSEPSTETSEPTEPPATAECPAEFVQEEYDRSEANPLRTQVVVGGVDPGMPAADKVNYYLEQMGHHAEVLDAYAHTLFTDYRDSGLTPADLVTDGCLNAAGTQWFYSVKGKITGEGTSAENGTVAEDAGHNSGINDGRLVVSEERRILGPNSAVILTFEDGTQLMLLDRCGNIVFPTAPPGVPKGPTDNPPPPAPEVPKTPDTPHVPVTPPKEEPPKETPPPKLTPKDVSQAPQNQGNLPEQQKPNPLPARPDHAQPTKPADPPPKYDAPAPPPPAPPAPAPSNPSPAPTRDPAPPPPPEPEAPDPTDAETGCIAIPGVQDCP